MDFYGLEGHKDLARDPDTNAVVNVNTLEYQQYLSRRNVKTEKNYKVQNMEQELANMKGDIDEIKFLLKELLHGPK
jgi:TolA-binding protein|tara:strand:+ start:2061 stop:2288 length:228 start_codon:yes stop_codon:yes gene_type:complete